jgi:peroxiredoxin 5
VTGLLSCSNVQVPGYVQNQDTLKAAGIDEVLVYCVNDGAVMRAWFENQKLGAEGSIVSMMADPSGEFTRACGMELTDPRPQSNGLLGRSKRFAVIVAKNIVKYVAVSEAPNDPAGDDDPSATCYEAMLKAWKEVSVEVSA